MHLEPVNTVNLYLFRYFQIVWNIDKKTNIFGIFTI